MADPKQEFSGDYADVAGGYTAEDLLPGVQYWESRGRPHAVSPKGAIGLYQIMPSTAADFGYTREDMFDPVKNRDVATKYLDKLLHKYNGNAYMALAAYNSGPRTVDLGILPEETQSYVHNVLDYTREYGAGKQAGTIQRVRRATSVPGGTTERPAPDPWEARMAELKKEIAGLDKPEAAQAQEQPPQPIQLPWMFYRSGASEEPITSLPSLYSPTHNLQNMWSGIQPTLQSAWSQIGSQIEPYTSQIKPAVGNLFQAIENRLPQSQVQPITPDFGETIS